jgi:hypothetical protein
MTVVNGKARESLEIGNEVAGERAIVDIRARDHTGHGHGLARVATLHHERHPLA